MRLPLKTLLPKPRCLDVPRSGHVRTQLSATTGLPFRSLSFHAKICKLERDLLDRRPAVLFLVYQQNENDILQASRSVGRSSVQLRNCLRLQGKLLRLDFRLCLAARPSAAREQILMLMYLELRKSVEPSFRQVLGEIDAAARIMLLVVPGCGLCPVPSLERSQRWHRELRCRSLDDRREGMSVSCMTSYARSLQQSSSVRTPGPQGKKLQ